MDKKIVYTTQLPLSTDFLQVQKNVEKALGQLASDILTSAAITSLLVGLACTPTSPASMQVQIGPGSIYQSGAADAAAFGSLAADSSTIFHQGIASATQLVPSGSAFAAPGTAGQSVNYLIQVQFQQVDGNNKVLNYYNAANPTVPLIGPAGAGTAQATDRVGAVVLQVVAGTAATTGSQTTPGVTAGWIPAYVVTIANGQSTITAPNIAIHASAPFLASLTSKHHTGGPGTAPKIDLTSEVQGALPPANVSALPVSNLKDFACAAGAGLVLNYNGGIVNMNGAPVTVAASSITLTGSATNYVFVGPGGTVVSNTTGFPVTGPNFPMAQVTCGAAAITGVSDVRAWATPAGASGGLTSMRAYRSASNQSITANTWTKVIFDVASYDSLSEYSTSTGRWTAQYAGTFMVRAGAQINWVSSAATDIRQIALYKNGALYDLLDYTAKDSASDNVFGSTQVKLVAGDYLEIYVYSSSGTPAVVASATGTSFSVTRF